MANITHEQNNNRFVLSADDGHHGVGAEAVLEYQLSANNCIDFSRTYVPPEFRGKGLAEKLVRSGLAWAKEQGFIISASCWYVAKFLD